MLFLRHFSRCGSNRGWGQKGIPMPVLSFGAIVQRSFSSVARRMKTKRAREEHQKWVHRMQRQRVIEKPWRKQGKLCTQPSLLYASAKLRAQKGMHDRKTSFLSLIAYRKNFDNLSAEERAPFIAQAAANRTARLRARARIKNLRISTYALFLKQNFKSTAVGVAGDSIREKLPMISRAIAKRWKAMCLRRKHEYRTEAQLLREKANKNLDLLMKGK